MSSPFPMEFVWTKMQAEAGQSLEAIVHRKELERRSGDGVFFWGIGNALGMNLNRLVARNKSPELLFSIMRSKPKRQDVTPKSVLLWTAYFDLAGQVRSIPRHVLLLSRGETETGVKRRHYALVCRSSEPLYLTEHGRLDASHFRNLGSLSPRIGASQVTAIVQHDERPDPQHTGMAHWFADPEVPPVKQERSAPSYDVNLRAQLVTPYFVRLASPRTLLHEAQVLIEGVQNNDLSSSEWITLVSGVHAASVSSDLTDSATDSLFHDRPRC